MDGFIVSSVVPIIDAPLKQMAQRYFKTKAFFVGPATETGLDNLYDNPREVGADRLVNASGAFHKYGGPCVVVDWARLSISTSSPRQASSGWHDLSRN